MLHWGQRTRSATSRRDVGEPRRLEDEACVQVRTSLASGRREDGAAGAGLDQNGRCKVVVAT